MAKKSTRKKRKQRKVNVPQYTPPTESQETVETVVAQPATAAAPARASQSTGSGMNSIDWPAEYPYVVGDLRSMAIVAALMVALLLGLNFFVN